ncbi:hypothetical protein ACP70R_013012 [Stipagrostis hirtigluma subsp. patula]
MAPKRKVPGIATRHYPSFDLILSDLKDTYVALMDAIPVELERILTREAPHNSKGESRFMRVHGKLFTSQGGGGFIIRFMPTRESPPEDHLVLLYRWRDLYFEAFHAKGKWFRFRDSELLLPPKTQVEFNEKGDWWHQFNTATSYFGLGGYDVPVGPEAFSNCYGGLMNADLFVQTGRVPNLKVMEGLDGVDGLEKSVPQEYSCEFHKWIKESRKLFDTPDPPDLEALKLKLGILKRSDRNPPPLKDNYPTRGG